MAKRSKKTVENPNLIGIASDLFNSVQSIDIPSTVNLQDCQNIYEDLTGKGLFDKCNGEIAWLKGKILNILKPIEKGKTGIAQQGEWKDFCESLSISPDTSENLRHINVRFTRNESRKLGYTEMVRTVRRKKTGNSGTTPKTKTTATVRIAGQTFARIPADLDAVLKVLTAAGDMDLATSIDEINNPAEVYGQCVQVLRHIEERARECVTEFEQRIDNIKQTDQQAEANGKTLDSREVVEAQIT